MKAADGQAVVAVGTTQGGFLLTANPSRTKWRKSPVFLKDDSVNNFAYSPEHGRLYAATLTEGVFVSRDMGKNWRPINKGLHIRKTWTVAVDPRDPAKLYAGTHYGHLFRSTDSAKGWEEVTGLFTAPKRNEWGIDWAFGTTGLCIHTIRIDSKNDKRLYIIASGNGLYRSDDSGESWKLLQNGVVEACPLQGSSKAPDMPKDVRMKKQQEHLERVHACTHKMVMSKKNPRRLYQQNHCGVYLSDDGGDSWSDRSPSDSLRHGFSIVLTEDGKDALYTVPAFQDICKKHNSCIQGELAVYKTEVGGRDWKKLSEGLPKDVHTCVLRDGMDTDGLHPAGVYFGTTTGEVYGSTDDGDSWALLTRGVGRVQGVVCLSSS